MSALAAASPRRVLFEFVARGGVVGRVRVSHFLHERNLHLREAERREAEGRDGSANREVARKIEAALRDGDIGTLDEIAAAYMLGDFNPQARGVETFSVRAIVGAAVPSRLCAPRARTPRSRRVNGARRRRAKPRLSDDEDHELAAPAALAGVRS